AARIVAPRSLENPNNCRGDTARIMQGRVEGRAARRAKPRRSERMETPPQQDEHEPAVADDQACYVGIDVSKATLDVAVRPSGQAWECPNDEPGVAAVVARLRALAPHLIVLEATGGLERLVATELALAELSVAVVNPRQVRDFAKATGRLAKTDAVDA